jgi:hypothetical protein
VRSQVFARAFNTNIRLCTEFPYFLLRFRFTKCLLLIDHPRCARQTAFDYFMNWRSEADLTFVPRQSAAKETRAYEIGASPVFDDLTLGEPPALLLRINRSATSSVKTNRDCGPAPSHKIKCFFDYAARNSKPTQPTAAEIDLAAVTSDSDRPNFAAAMVNFE